MENDRDTLQWDFGRVANNPPVFRALALLGCPDRVTARACGYSAAMISHWRRGRQDIMPAQIAALTTFCSSLIDTVEQNWDVLPKPGRATVKLVLDTARVLIAIQRSVTFDEDMLERETEHLFQIAAASHQTA
jgi:hypothetical protein